MAAATEWVTPQYATKRQPTALCGPVLLYGFECVLGAGWAIDAGIRQQRRNISAVPLNEYHHRPCDNALFVTRVGHATRALLMSCRNAPATSSGDESCVARVANRMMSASFDGRPHERAASLKTLLHLLRNTAFPSRLGATNATRPVCGPPRSTVARTSGWLYLLPPEKTRSNSFLDLMVSMLDVSRRR